MGENERTDHDILVTMSVNVEYLRKDIGEIKGTLNSVDPPGLVTRAALQEERWKAHDAAENKWGKRKWGLLILGLSGGGGGLGWLITTVFGG